MLSREDFIFTIGYDGPAAIVDGQAKKRYSKLSTAQLAEKGLFRAACASAILSNDPKEMEIVAKKYGTDVPLQRLFGVYPVDVSRTIVL